MLHLGRCRENVVCVQRGVGHEVVENHGEEIRALQSFENEVLVRSNGRGVAVVHDHRPNRGVELAVGQCLTELYHVDRSDCVVLQAGHYRGLEVERLLEESRGEVLQTATQLAPCPDERR